MTACETCWGDAYALSRMLGGSQVEHYQRLLVERADDHAADRAELTKAKAALCPCGVERRACVEHRDEESNA